MTGVSESVPVPALSRSLSSLIVLKAAPGVRGTPGVMGLSDSEEVASVSCWTPPLKEIFATSLKLESVRTVTDNRDSRVTLGRDRK